MGKCGHWRVTAASADGPFSPRSGSDDGRGGKNTSVHGAVEEAVEYGGGRGTSVYGLVEKPRSMYGVGAGPRRTVRSGVLGIRGWSGQPAEIRARRLPQSLVRRSTAMGPARPILHSAPLDNRPTTPCVRSQRVMRRVHPPATRELAAAATAGGGTAAPGGPLVPAVAPVPVAPAGWMGQACIPSGGPHGVSKVTVGRCFPTLTITQRGQQSSPWRNASVQNLFM